MRVRPSVTVAFLQVEDKDLSMNHVDLWFYGLTRLKMVVSIRPLFNIKFT